MKKSFISVISMLIGLVIGAGAVHKSAEKKRKDIQSMSDKHLSLFLMMNQWVKLKQKNKNLKEYFERKGYHNIAVYGMSYAGETLIEEVKSTEIKIKYGIDRNVETIYSDIDLVSPDDQFEKVDAVVVTAITFFEQIEEMLSEKVDCPVISLEDIISEMQ